MTAKARILKLIDVTQERVRKGSNAAGCFEVLRDEIEKLFENKNKGANEKERRNELWE